MPSAVHPLARSPPHLFRDPHSYSADTTQETRSAPEPSRARRPPPPSFPAHGFNHVRARNAVSPSLPPPKKLRRSAPPPRTLLAVRRPKHCHQPREKQCRPNNPHRMNRHVVVRNHPPYGDALGHNHQPRHSQKPAFERRKTTQGMEVRVHVPTLHPSRLCRCARVGQSCASFWILPPGYLSLICPRPFPRANSAR